ncbi:uncharacterized protein LOC116424632 isoform X2 [Nomia melanderi]|uniref:uncharacterized protein LOC116424632 isoform X2 n=1 Tax=Nomia melanderi TaxID=2448451 RepID=UPI003FCC5AAE
MSRQYCFLCASDEGVFLDITVENKQIFCEQFEICSLVKVPTSDELPTKICHKCAYELKQCSTFLQKYKNSLKPKTQSRGKQCCGICHLQTKKEYTFDLRKENSLQRASIDKIQKVFNDEVNRLQGNNKFICLSCRYTVDVLCDLKHLSEETSSKLDNIINKKIDYSNFPQVKTAVVNRKTTITESARATLKVAQDSDSDSSTMTRTRSKNKVNNKLNNKVNAKPKEQVCQECENTIKSDSEAYKIKKTGQSICKVCWENKRSNAKDAETSQSSAETKVCKVFLKDVLSQPAPKKGKLNKVKEDNQSKRQLRVTGKKEKRSSNLSSDAESDAGKQAEKRTLRTTNSEDTDSSDRPYKRPRRNVRDVTESESPTSVVPSKITRGRKAVENNKRKSNQSSESDSALNSAKEREGPSTRQKRAKYSDTNDESSTDDGGSRKKKLKFSDDVTIMIDLTNTKEDEERPRRNASTRNNANPEKAIKPALVKRSSQKSELSETVEKIMSDGNTDTYSCEECGVNYENKTVFLTHKLTHYKQPKLQLERVTVGTNVEPPSHTSEELDDQSEDQSEAITIRVDDDEEETGLKENNMDVSNEVDSSSRTEETAGSPKKDVLKEAADGETVAKEAVSDHEQSTEKDSRTTRSISRRSKISLSESDKDNVENIPEATEEEPVEDISLTNIDDDQEEEDKEKEQEANKENEKESEEAVTVTETEEIKKQSDKEKAVDTEKESETTSEDTSSKLKSSKDGSEDVADIDKSKSSETTDETKDEEKDKLDSADKTEESEAAKKDDSATSKKSEENETEGEEKLSEKSEEEKMKEKSEKKDKPNCSNEPEEKDKSSCSKESEEKDKSSCSKESEEKDKSSCSKEPEEKDKSSCSKESDEDKPSHSKQSEEDKTSCSKESEEDKSSCSKEPEKDKPSCSKEPEDKDKSSCSKEPEDKDKSSSCKQSEETKKLDSSAKHDEEEIVEAEENDEIVEINSRDSSDDIKEVTQRESDDEVEIQCTQKVSNNSRESTDEIVILENNKSTNDVQTSDSGVLEIDSSEPVKQSTDSADAAAEILQEVLDLASAEVQKRQDVVDVDGENNSGEAETLENISREVQNGGGASRNLD